jgi:hypothetical protein
VIISLKSKGNIYPLTKHRVTFAFTFYAYYHAILNYITVVERISSTLRNIISPSEVSKTLGSRSYFRNSSSLNCLEIYNVFMDLKICSYSIGKIFQKIVHHFSEKKHGLQKLHLGQGCKYSYLIAVVICNNFIDISRSLKLQLTDRYFDLMFCAISTMSISQQQARPML